MQQVQELPVDFVQMRSAAGRACCLMKVLSNPDRLLLLCELSKGERCVGELETLVGVMQPTLSQQLTVLREEGVVATRKEGKHVYYRIDSESAMAVMHVLYEQFCQEKSS